jgi:hypothetical protein
VKGVIYNLLESCVSSEYGEDTWDDVLEATGLDGAYTSLGSYPDQDFTVLVAAAAERLGMPANTTIRWFGRNAMPLLAEQYPEFFVRHASTRGFLLELNRIHHAEVRKLYTDADLPMFSYDGTTDEMLVLSYRSTRKLCAFGEGLLEGAATHFGEQIAIAQPDCMLRGDDHCTLQIALS